MKAGISVILPVYNGLPYLEQAVQSVLNQDYSNFELLVLDDASTDGSWKYLQSLEDSRIRIFRNDSNKGLFPNLNFLIRESNATLIKLWSQDDVMYTNCLTVIVDFHTQHPEIGFSYTGRDYIDADGNITGSHINDDTPSLVTTGLHAAIACYTGSIAGNIANVTISRNVFENCGYFNEKMIISGDFEMWIRISLKYTIGFIKENLICLRNHSGQLSRQEKYYLYHMLEDLQAYKILFSHLTKDQIRRAYKLLRNHKLLFYYTLMLKSIFKFEFNTAWGYISGLHSFDNLFLLTLYYIKIKLFGRSTFVKKPL